MYGLLRVNLSEVVRMTEQKLNELNQELRDMVESDYQERKAKNQPKERFKNVERAGKALERLREKQ